MYARVTRLQGPPYRLDEGIALVRDEVIPAARELHGFKGGYWLAQRSTGEVIAFTFWATEDLLHESREATNKLRVDAAGRIGATVLSVEEYEVVAEA